MLVTGSGFTHVTGVRFAGAPGTSIHVFSDTQLYVTTTAHTQGTINVQVVTTQGVSPVSVADYFTYVARPVLRTISPKGGPTVGGMRVAVLGSNFRQVSAVNFGSVPGKAVQVVSSSLLYVTSPSHVAGIVGVHVITHTALRSTSPSIITRIRSKRARCGPGTVPGAWARRAESTPCLNFPKSSPLAS